MITDNNTLACEFSLVKDIAKNFITQTAIDGNGILLDPWTSMLFSTQEINHITTEYLVNKRGPSPIKDIDKLYTHDISHASLAGKYKVIANIIRWYYIFVELFGKNNVILTNAVMSSNLLFDGCSFLTRIDADGSFVIHRLPRPEQCRIKRV